MSEEYTVIDQIRAVIGDDDPVNERFTDDQINSLINVACNRLQAAAATFLISISDGELSKVPTPTEYALLVMQVQCILANRDLNSAIRKGVRVKQDENEVDTSAGLSAFIQAVTGKGGICDQLKDAIKDYITNGDTDGSAAAQYGENIWSGNRNVYDDVTHNGQFSERKNFPRGFDNIDREGETGDFDPFRHTGG